MLPETSAYVKSYDEQNKLMYFVIENDDLLEKYNGIRDKVRVDIKKEFDSKPVYNKTFLKTKIKSNDDEVTHFHDKEISQVDSTQTSVAAVSLDSALKKNENYYLQVILKEFK